MNKSKHPVRNFFLIIFGFIIIAAFSFAICHLSVFHGKNLRVPFDGDTSRSHIVDNKEILSNETETRLNKLVREYSEKLQMNIFIYVSGTKYSDSQTESFAANTYNELAGEDFTDGCIYYLDFSGKRPAYDYLWVSGKAGIIYPDNLSEVTDKVVPYLPPSSKKNITEDDVVPGIEHFLMIIENYYNKYSQSFFRYTEDEQNKLYFFDTGSEYYCTKKMAPGARVSVFMTSLSFGYILALVIYFIVKHKYKFKDKTNPSIYVAKGETNFRERSDIFIREYTTKTKIETNSGSHGGGHRGGGGGGHSGGGRGGGSHR